MMIERNMITHNKVSATMYGYKYWNTFERMGTSMFFSK